MSEPKSIISKSLEKSISAEDYKQILTSYSRNGKTSGPEQNEDLIYYTRLNAQRSRRIEKTLQLSQELIDEVQKLPKQTWLIITETWCGDAANSVPAITKLAEQNAAIDVRIVMRDENPELMDMFLTNGGRSIPKVIGLDENLHVLFDWGPRPQVAQDLYMGWRNREERKPYSQFQMEMQKWYNDNKAKDLQQELLDIFRTAVKQSRLSEKRF